MVLQGKGFLIFNLPECEGGDPAAILAAAQEAGLSHVLIRIADGATVCGLDTAGVDLVAPVVQTLRACGIAVWGWQHVCGTDPLAEASTGIVRIQALGLDGFVVEAREEFSNPGKADVARQYMAAVRAALKIPIALNSYHFPNYHPELPWSTFLEFCDFHMPQVTWEQAHDASDQLRESKLQCDALPNARPYIPTGAAYATHGWNPTAEDMIEFLNTARELNLPAVNFYHWASCRRDLPSAWKAIAEFSWPAPSQVNLLASPPTTPLDDFLFQFLGALNSRQAARAAALYDPSAVQVWADQIRHGTAAIQAGFGGFFANLPAGTVINISQAKVKDDQFQFSWQANALCGATTLVLQDGKITLDYTSVS
jgi:hypothetical protein